MSSKYYETSTAIQVLGGILNTPTIVAKDSLYRIVPNDFDNDFHKVMFICMSFLVNNQTRTLNAKTIENYLSNHPNELGIYRANNGAEWVHRVYQEADIMNFDYYYNRLKKMSLLREYDNNGFHLDWIYDPDNILDAKKKSKQAKDLDNLSIQELAEIINNKVQGIQNQIIQGEIDETRSIGEGLQNTVDSLMVKSATGNSLYDRYTSVISMGARRGKFYLRSAGTGVGNTWAIFNNF